jgi:hypothetical protein
LCKFKKARSAKVIVWKTLGVLNQENSQIILEITYANGSETLKGQDYFGNTPLIWNKSILALLKNKGKEIKKKVKDLGSMFLNNVNVSQECRVSEIESYTLKYLL